MTHADPDPRAVPAYKVVEAAHYLHLPAATLRSWVKGRPYATKAGQRRFVPLIELPDPRASLLSFTNLVEAHVLAAMRKDHRIRMDRVRTALAYVRRELHLEHPLAHARFETHGVSLFIRKYGDLVNASAEGQLAFRELLTPYLRRIECDAAGLAIRLYLLTRRGAIDSPRSVFVDPRIGFGRPVLAGPCVPTAVVFERYMAGESVEALARDFDCEAAAIDEAIRAEHSEAA